MQASRRAFLFGRRAPATPWEQFYRHLARTCQGPLEELGTVNGVATAHLAPAGIAEVWQARALCAQYGVCLGLADAHCAAPNAATLWLNPALALNRLAPLSGAAGLWRAEAGVRVADLYAAGLKQFANYPPDMTLAVWLARQAGELCATGRTAQAGVLGLDVMLADGTRTVLGPFGERDVQPLRNAVVQTLIPKLFELSASEDAQACLRMPCWPARVRLDALHPCGGAVNLAHLLLGHRGSLAWVEAAVLSTPASLSLPPALLQGLPTPIAQAAARLDAAVQSLFDPADLFMACR